MPFEWHVVNMSVNSSGPANKKKKKIHLQLNAIFLHRVWYSNEKKKNEKNDSMFSCMQKVKYISVKVLIYIHVQFEKYKQLVAKKKNGLLIYSKKITYFSTKPQKADQ